MDQAEKKMTRYLLGELTESEKARLEESYFSNPEIFDQVMKTESDLVDNYVRGRLTSETRKRFQHSYLANPRLSERVKFAEVLALKLAEIEDSRTVGEARAANLSWLQKVIALVHGQRPTFAFSLALVTLLVIVGGLWLFNESRRLRQDLAQTQQARADDERRARELKQQAAAEHKGAEGLRAELDRLRTAQQEIPLPASTPVVRPFATLLLTVSGVRGTSTGPPPTLVIPAGTPEARIQLHLKENDFQSYRISLRAVGGEEILSRQGLRPKKTKTGGTFVLTMGTNKLVSGDYILTLIGARKDGEVEDVSMSLFRVEKR